MLSKLSVLKDQFAENYNPDIKVRVDRIKRLQLLVEENMDSFHKSLQSDFGSRHEQMSLLSDT